MADEIESGSQTPCVPWWNNLRDDVCVLQFDERAGLAGATTAFTGVAYAPDGAEVLCFDVPPSCPSCDENMQDTVRLTMLTDTSSTIFHLRVAQYTDARLCVFAQPLAIQRRYLRRAPRVSYALGPYPAVVHAADKQWRGVIELWLRDVSEYGVGFKAELGRAYLLCVGDLVRCPIVLPDGRRTWIEGVVTWLNSDGSGGIATRKTPVWMPDSSRYATSA